MGSAVFTVYKPMGTYVLDMDSNGILKVVLQYA